MEFSFPNLPVKERAYQCVKGSFKKYVRSNLVNFWQPFPLFVFHIYREKGKLYRECSLLVRPLWANVLFEWTHSSPSSYFAYNNKQPLSNFQAHFGKSAKQPQAEMKNGVAYKKKMCTRIVYSIHYSQSMSPVDDLVIRRNHTEPVVNLCPKASLFHWYSST